MLPHCNRTFFRSVSRSEVKLAEEAGCEWLSLSLLALPAAAVQNRADKVPSQLAQAVVQGCAVKESSAEWWQCESEGWALFTCQITQKVSSDTPLQQGSPVKHIKHCLCSSWPQPEPSGGKMEERDCSMMWGCLSPSSPGHQKHHSQGSTQVPAWLEE